jgi:hypothetical protein
MMVDSRILDSLYKLRDQFIAFISTLAAPDPMNTAIDTPNAIKIESKEKTYQECNPEAKAEESIKYPSETLFAIIIFILFIIYIAIFGGINRNINDTLDTSNRTIPVIIPVNDINQNPGSPILGTWKFENTQGNTQGIVSTIIFDENDNAILDGKPFKYRIDKSNIILKDTGSSSAIPFKLVDEKNILLKLRGSNYDNYVNKPS